ncbi:MAG: glycosyltransferase [Phycisphaeraceae bacterium]|nr:glycosyltransferase [Phycisphaeraceae bacterium]
MLVLPDRSFLRRERKLLSRLEIGLADEGVRVLHAVPHGWSSESEAVGVYSTPIGYNDTGLPWTEGLRAGVLIRSILSAAPPGPDERVFDLVHAFGEQSWPLAAELAVRTGTVLVLEAWRPSCGRLLLRTLGRVKSSGGADRAVVIAADDRLVQPLARVAPGATIVPAPWGVHLPESINPPPRPGQTRSAVLLASGAQASAVHAAFAGLAALTEHGAEPAVDLMVFADADCASRCGLWKLARTLDMHRRLSIIAELEGKRELVLQADALVLPETLGEQRTLVLDAMAHGMPVVAAPDPGLSAIVPATTCATVARPTADAWAGALRPVLGAAPQAPFAASARQWVGANRLASAQVAAVLRVYQTWGRRFAARAGVGSGAAS